MIRLLSSFILALGLLASCTRERVLAEVGNQKITEKEFQEFVSTLPEQWQVRAKTPAGKKQILDYLVRNKLIRIEAERRGIPNRPEVKKKIEDAEQRIITQELLTEFRKNLSIPEDELKKYYEQHKAEFTTPELVHLQQILIRTPSADPKEVEKAMKKAESLLKRAQKGEPFDQLARKNSDDPATASKGGDQGYLPVNQLDPLIARTIQGVNPGQIVGPTRTAMGWHVIKVVDRKPGNERPFSEVREEVIQRYTPQYQQIANEKFFEDLKQRYKVRIEEKNLEGTSESTSAPQGATQAR
jgi:parvulin-like peptidyl-prolyl isomerase